MALIGNRSVLHKSPGRFLNGNAAAGGGIANLRSNGNKHGMCRNAFQVYSPLSATPYGHLSPSAWILPKTGGGMSSINYAGISFTFTGAGAEGVNGEGSTSFSISIADAAGELISSGTGTASFSISTLPLLLTASLAAVGEASFTISTNAPLLGAEASAIGTATFAITGTMTPYAIGSMSGSTVDSSTLTTAAIIAAMNASPPGVNIKLVNDVVVTGTGSTGDEWGP